MWLAELEAIMAARKRKARYPDVLKKPIQLKRLEVGLWLHVEELRRQAGRAYAGRFDERRIEAHTGRSGNYSSSASWPFSMGWKRSRSRCGSLSRP